MSNEDTVQFDVDNLTVGQAEFLSEYTGRTIQELMDVIETKEYMGRDLTAMLAVVLHPEDPEAGLEDVRNMKASDISVS